MSVGTYGTADLRRADSDLTKDEVFTLLSNPRRRCVLHYLRGVDEAAELGEMATRIAAWENDTTAEELTPDQRKAVYTSLQQTHLKKLDEAGIVEFDTEQKEVWPTETAEEIEVYLEIVPGKEFPWREYYLALGAISCSLVIVTWGGVGPFALVPDIAVAGLLAGVLTLSAIAHVYHERNMRLGVGGDPAELAHARNK